MPRSISTSSTIEFTPSNSDENSSRDKAPMDDTINIKVPAAVAAKWIAKGVGVPVAQAKHNKSSLAHIDSSRVGMSNREALEAKVAKLEKNTYMDKSHINHTDTQIIEKLLQYKAGSLLGVPASTLPASTHKIDSHLDGNRDPMPAPVGHAEPRTGTVKKVSHAPRLDHHIRSPSQTLSINSAPTFVDIPSYATFNKTLRQQAKAGNVKKVNNLFDLDRVISAFVPCSTDSLSTGPAMAQLDKSAAEKRLDASLNIDRAIEAFRTHLDDARITGLSDFDSAIEAFRTELLHDKPAERIKTAVKKPASCWVCGLTGHVPRACPKSICGYCGQAGHLVSFCPSHPCADCHQEGHIAQDCPQALECDNLVHNHNHQTVKIDNSPEQTGGMHSPEAIKDCKGCWDGCDACCPELEDDANQQASAPLDPRLGSPICSCGKCDSCLSSFGIEGYCVRGPAPLPNRNGEMSFADLFQDPEVCRGCESGCDECWDNDTPDVGWAFHNLGFFDTEAVTFEELTTKFNELLKLRPGLAEVYGKSYTTIIAHERKTGKWAGLSPEHRKQKASHAVVKGAAEMNLTRLRHISAQDDLDNLPDSNKENSDEHVDVKLPKWGAFGVYCLEQNITPQMADPEIVTAPKSNDQGWIGSDGDWGPALPPQSSSFRPTSNAMPGPRSLYSHPIPDGSIPKKPTFRQPSIVGLGSDLGCSEFNNIWYDPLTITYSVSVQAGGKTVNIPLNSKNISGVQKEVVNGGMKKVWKWALERGLGNQIDLQDVYELAKDMHGGVEEEVEENEQSVIDTVSVRSEREDGVPNPKGWTKAMSSPPPSLHNGAHGWGSAPATVYDQDAFLACLSSAPNAAW
jgi:hypothetical protein